MIWYIVCGVVFSVVLSGCGLYGMVMGTMWCVCVYVYSMWVVYGVWCKRNVCA